MLRRWEARREAPAIPGLDQMGVAWCGPRIVVTDQRRRRPWRRAGNSRATRPCCPALRRDLREHTPRRHVRGGAALPQDRRRAARLSAERRGPQAPADGERLAVVVAGG